MRSKLIFSVDLPLLAIKKMSSFSRVADWHLVWTSPLRPPSDRPPINLIKANIIISTRVINVFNPHHRYQSSKLSPATSSSPSSLSPSSERQFPLHILHLTSLWTTEKHKSCNYNPLSALFYYSNKRARHTVKAVAALNKTLPRGRSTDGFSTA